MSWVLINVDGSAEKVPAVKGDDAYKKIQTYIGNYFELTPRSPKGCVGYCDEEGAMTGRPYNSCSLFGRVRGPILVVADDENDGPLRPKLIDDLTSNSP